MKTQPAAIFLVLVASFIGSFGAVFLKAASRTLQLNFFALLTNTRLILGVLFFLFSSYFYVRGVSHPGSELTVLFPLLSTQYFWTLIWSRLFFQEPITSPKILGVSMILAGVGILQLGNRH